MASPADAGARSPAGRGISTHHLCVLLRAGWSGSGAGSGRTDSGRRRHHSGFRRTQGAASDELLLVTRDPAWISLYFPIFRPGQLLEVVVERWLSLFDVFLAAQTKAEHDGWTMISFNDLGAEPGLAFCGNKPAHILLPDFAFLQSRGYEKARAHFADNQPPWEERSSRVFWRGSSVGQKHHPILEMPRARLCLLAREMGDAWGDIGMVELFHISDEDAAELRRQGFVKDKVAWKDLSRYRFHIDIDGHAASYAGLFRKLLSGGLVLKVQSPDRCVQWYYDRLVPGINFVPVREDLSDLVEVVADYRETCTGGRRDCAARSRAGGFFRLTKRNLRLRCRRSQRRSKRRNPESLRRSSRMAH